ncbi:outer membrane protein [Pelagibacterium lentulum]|uniref:Outer membrane protein beta-barrel domain-containing protein n=1 Tax=Pelagibacterium lentulum TaxID=2029865 RepID=A0A916RDL4_9HYPH|nr:outer membrane beta-barrel protein [Pelagibacterium lentulum]GGA51924.1 hypothetical protein GCM10011499_22470 [Pelagibacterium lentulum]
MNSLKTVAVAALLSTTALGGAFAADAIGMPPPPPAAEIPVFDQPSGFDWNGFYAGGRVGGLNQVDGDTHWTLGGQVGVNAAFDIFVLGAELGIDAVFDEDETYAYGEILARGGIIVTNELLAYAAVGYGSDFDATNGPGDHILAGGGLEFAMTDDVTVRGQYLYGWDQTNDATSTDVHKFTIGANFHF